MNDYFKEDGYELVIDFPSCSIPEMMDIIGLLYIGPRACHEDIIIAGNDIIRRMDKVGYGLKGNPDLIKLVKKIFKCLNKIYEDEKCQTKMDGIYTIIMTIYKKYEDYKTGSPNITPVQSPKIEGK